MRLSALSAALIFLAVSTPSFASLHPNRSSGKESMSRPGTSHVDMPMVFESSQGSRPAPVKFFARGVGYSVWLAPQQITLAVRRGRQNGDTGIADRRSYADAIKVDLLGSDPNCEVSGLEPAAGKVNYFIGNDPSQWRPGVPIFGKVKFKNVYPGIDIVFYGTGTQLEYDFVVASGANPNQIKLGIGGAVTSLGRDGSLVLGTTAGVIAFGKPHIYQRAGREKRWVAGNFVIDHSSSGQQQSESTVTLALGSYDKTKPLIIDPILDYSTYLGGSDNDYLLASTIDSAGNLYVTGGTSSFDFPVTAGAFQPSCVPGPGDLCNDAVVAKINSAGSSLVYATYLGGNSYDYGLAIAVDSSGNAYVTGGTSSTNFPTTVGAFQTTCGGTCFYDDVFVSKLDSAGSTLLYSTYLGGSNQEFASGIALNQGNVYVSGFSASTDFPVTPGVYQPNEQGQGSSFVTQFNSSGTGLVYSTFLGEVDLQNYGPTIALDSAGNAYLAGVTLSSNYPVTAGAFATPFLGFPENNLYISKLNPTATALLYSAFVGGASATSISVDGLGQAYLVGLAGPLFPVTPGALNSTCSSDGIIILKLSADGSSLPFSAHLCADLSYTAGATIDQSGNVLFTGNTSAANFPVTVGAFQTVLQNACCFTDGFLTKLKSDGSALVYSTYIGGNSSDNGSGLTLDTAGNVFLSGATNSTNFPVKNPLQPLNAGFSDGFAAKITLPRVKISVWPAALNFGTFGIGTPSTPLAVTIANTSSSSISIASIVASSDFSATNTCGKQLAAGAHCTAAVLFTATTTGNSAGTLTITDSVGSQMVSLTGTGASGPVVAFSPDYQFYNQPQNFTSPPLTITATNFGNADLNVTSVQLTNGPIFNFARPSDCLRGPVAPLGSCTIEVNFTPFSFGQAFATLTLIDNGGQQAFGLLGNGVGPGVYFSNFGLRWNQQRVGTTGASQIVALVNGSSAPLAITGVTASGDFTESNTCGTSLASGKFCYIKVRFKPSAVGIRQASVTVSDNAVGGPQVLPLIGTGGP